jgi:hypothetical protein
LVSFIVVLLLDLAIVGDRGGRTKLTFRERTRRRRCCGAITGTRHPLLSGRRFDYRVALALGAATKIRKSRTKKRRQKRMHGVSGGHGQANRLLIEDIDPEQFDRLVAKGGVGGDVQEAALVESMRAGNKLLGPSRFGKMF